MRSPFGVRLQRNLAVLAAGTALACGGGGGGGGGGGVTWPSACSSTAPTPNPSGIAGTVCYHFVPSTVSGALEFSHAVLKPARNVSVEVVQGTTTLATTTTDETGHYSLNFTPGSSGALELRVFAETTTPSIQVVDNTASKAIWGVSAGIDASTHAKDLVAIHGWTGSSYDESRRLAAPFAILDTMYTAAQAFLAVRSVTFPALKVNWSPKNYYDPYGGADPASGDINTSHFTSGENQIYILGKEGNDTDEFDNHVIAHEWGHFFEYNLSRSDSPGGPHSGGDVLDPRLAFGEGYGNAIAAMVLGDTMYVDSNWNTAHSLVAWGFDAETEPGNDDPHPGACSEMTILRLLYDLYDTGTNESQYDQIGVGLGTIYDVLTGPEWTTDALTTIGSFITGLKVQTGVNAAAVNTLLAHYNIGPIADQWGTGDHKSNLQGLQDMYIGVGSFPETHSIDFDGGPYNFNKWYENQYYVFTGNGNQVTISASSSSAVSLKVYRSGQVVDATNASGTETVHVSGTIIGQKYVVVLTGWEDSAVTYTVNISFSSP